MTALLEREADQLIPISAATLRQGAKASFNIYVRATPTDEPVLFCSADQEITAAQIGRMTKNDKLFIHRDDRNLYQGFLRENYEETIADDQVPVENRVSILSEVIRDVLGEQFTNGSTQSIVESCQQLGKNSATLLSSEALIPRELCSVLHHDFGTFTHSANVSAYAVVLGRALGFNAGDLEQIAVGALLHDLGKLDISDKILNKPGKLTDSEFATIKKHPTAGLLRVGNRSDLTFGQQMMIYQHHERLNGTGYPVGCSENEIHPWGKLCAIVDVFEALTSHRPYRVPFSHATAFAVLNKGSGVEFDREMLRCWQRILSV